MTHDENERLTSIGPGTEMGALMRQYWLPTLRSEELPNRDGDPVRVMLLGERLIAFRDSKGAIGLLDEACPHRGASLFFGRAEHGGLRCAYHGWKFDVSGRCMEIPCDPPDSALQRRVRANAYPCIERHGIIWAYLGPRESPPPLPELETNMEAAGPGRVDLSLTDCNWLQNLEGDVDLDHIKILHGGNLESFKATLRGAHDTAPDPERPRAELPPHSLERLPTEVADSAVGCTFACDISAGARRGRAEPATPFPQMWGIGQFMFPFYSMLPYGSLGSHWVAARVPMDDRHTMTFGIHAAHSALPSQELMFGPEPAYLPNSPDWFGRFRMSRNADNDFCIDRSLARSGARGAFAMGSGVRGQAIQDACITRSMGQIADRSREHLGMGDVVVARVRKRLREAALALSERGVTPPGVDYPSGYRVRQGVLRVRNGHSWRSELGLGDIPTWQVPHAPE